MLELRLNLPSSLCTSDSQAFRLILESTLSTLSLSDYTTGLPCVSSFWMTYYGTSQSLEFVTIQNHSALFIFLNPMVLLGKVTQKEQ